MAWRLVVMLLACAASQALGQRIVNTSGITIGGFAFTYDITDYRNFTIEVRNVQRLVEAGKWSAAKQIYQKGQTPFKRKYLIAFAENRMEYWFGQRFFELYRAFYGNRKGFIAKYMGGFTSSSSTPTTIAIGLQWLQLSYVGNQLDVVRKFIDGKLVPKDLPKAHREVDDAYAVYYGYPECLTLHNFHATRWATCAPANINSRALTLIKAISSAAKTGNVASYEANYAAFWKLMATGYLRAIVAAASRKNLKQQAYADGYLRMIHPIIGKANKDAADLKKELGRTTKVADVDQVRKWVAGIAKAMSIPAADAGIC